MRMDKVRLYWAITDILLIAGLAGWFTGFYLAIALCIVQVVHFALLERSLTSFPVQVRVAYLGLLVIALWEPLRFIYLLQVIGTTAMVLFDYCFLARCLSLLPWNRRTPLSARLVMKTFFSKPVAGRIEVKLS